MKGSSLSANRVDGRSPERRYTVAELVARERATGHRRRSTEAWTESTGAVSVADLLRREGVRFAGEDSPTIELNSLPVHVSELLRRTEAVPESLTDADEDKPRSRKAVAVGAVGGVAAIAGLTLAGLIALKPQFAFTPGDTAAIGEDGSTNTTVYAEGDRSPTGSTTTLSRDYTRTSASTERPGDPAAAGQDQSAAQDQPGGGSGNGTRTTTPVSENDGSAPGSTSVPTTTPTDNTEPPKQDKPTPPEEEQPDDGGDDNGGGLLDPVLDPVLNDVVDPVVGTITGTLFP